MKEQPLIAFTLLSQVSVGVFLALVSGQFGLNLSLQAHRQNLLLPLIICGVLIGVSLTLSLLHLGSPRQAVHALRNVSDSWLSREIFFGLVYMLCGASFTASLWLPGVAMEFVFFLAAMTAASGMAFLYSMGRIYMLRTVPVWNTHLTPLTFFLSALSLGYLANCIIISLNENTVRQQLFATTGQIATLWLSLQIITATLFTTRLRGILGLKFAAYLIHGERINKMLLARMVTIILACLSAGLCLSTSNQTLLLPLFASTTFLLAFISELIGRLVFYHSYQRSGL